MNSFQTIEQVVLRWCQYGFLPAFAVAIFVTASVEAQFDRPPTVAENSFGVNVNSKAKLPARALLRVGSNCFRPATATVDLALSPDGKFVVSLGNNLSVWDAANGNELWSVKLSDLGMHSSGGNYGDRAVVFGPDSSKFFTTGNVNQCLSWDTSTGRKTVLGLQSGFDHIVPVKREEYAPALGTPTAIDVSPDGRMIALSSGLGVIVALQNGEVLAKFKNQPDDIVYGKGPLEHDRLTYSGHYSVGRFSPRGNEMAVVTSDAPTKIRMVDLKDFSTSLEIPLTSWLVRLDFSPDGKQLATTERDESVRLYDIATGRQLWSRKIELQDLFENYVFGVAFAPDGSTIAVTATDKFVYLLDRETGAIKRQLVGHRSPPSSVVFSRDSKMLYSSGQDAIISRWIVSNGVQVVLAAGVYPDNCIAASPVSRMIAFDDDRGTIHLVDSTNGNSIHAFSTEAELVSAIKFSPNGHLLAAAGIRGKQIWTEVWNLETHERKFLWEWPQGPDLHASIEEIAFSPDVAQMAAVSFRQDSVFLWDLTDGKQVALIPHKSVYGVSFSPTEPTLATGGWDSKVRFWNSRDGKPIADIDVKESMKERQRASVYHVCYSPDGRFIAVGHDSLTISLWSTQDLELRSRFKYHPSGGWGTGDLNFSPDGLWLSSTDMSSTVKLWDPYSGQKVMDVSPQVSTGSPLEFGANGTTLVSGPWNGYCYVWDVATPRPDDGANVESLWNALAGNSAPDAYNAFWALANLGDEAVAIIDRKLSQADKVLDSHEMTKSMDSEAASRRKILIEKLLSNNPRAVRIEVVQRSMAILARIRSERALSVLSKLTTDAPVEAIRGVGLRVVRTGPN